MNRKVTKTAYTSALLLLFYHVSLGGAVAHLGGDSEIVLADRGLNTHTVYPVYALVSSKEWRYFYGFRCYLLSSLATLHL